MLHRSIQELFHLCKFYNLIELLLDLTPAHSQNRTVQVDVFPACELGVKTCAHFQQTANTAMNLGPAGGRFGDPTQDLEQGALTGPIASNNPHHFSWLDLKAKILQCPERG